MSMGIVSRSVFWDLFALSASMSTNPALPVLAPSVVGLWLNIFLFGVMSTQTFFYFNTFRDKTWIRCYVLLLFLVDFLNSVFDAVWTYQCLVLNYNNPGYLSQSNWVLATDPVMTAIIGSLVQVFFAWRAYVLTQRWWLMAIILSTSLISLAAGTVSSVVLNTLGDLTLLRTSRLLKGVATTWLITTGVCDILITAVLTWHLRKHRTKFGQTNTRLTKIIRLTTQTGMITAVVAVITITLFLSDSSGLHFAFSFPLSKLYTNSVLSTLNVRSGWKYDFNAEPSTQQSSSGAESGRRKIDVMQLTNFSSRTRPEVRVRIESKTTVDPDDKRAIPMGAAMEDASLNVSVSPNPEPWSA